MLATSTPDQTFPATSVSVQAGLGITRGAAFDLQAVCSGFVYALQVTDAVLRNGTYKRALVIGAETFSRILDWSDRTTCVLFGDGAGALVLEAQPQPGTREDRGILTTHLRADGRHRAKPRRRRAIIDPVRVTARWKGAKLGYARPHHRCHRGRLQGHGYSATESRLVVPHQTISEYRFPAQARYRAGKVVLPWTVTAIRLVASIPLAVRCGSDRRSSVGT